MAGGNSVGNMIPGYAGMNWLSGVLGQQQNSANRRPTPNSQAVEQQRQQALRRQRLAQQLQNNASQSGRAPLSENELNAALAEWGM